MANLDITKKIKEFTEKQSWTEDKGGKTNGRPSIDEYFMQMAHLIKTRGTCQRRQVGAVIVKHKHLLSTGYNGNPKGIKHCDEIGCLRDIYKVPSGERHELCTGLHAEQNAIIQAALFGVSIKGSTMYCTNSPCSVCAKMMINAGIEELIYENGYPDSLAEKMLKDGKVKVRKYKKK